jgi:hypothetical protein
MPHVSGEGWQSRSSTSRSSSHDNSARRGVDEPSSLQPYAPSSQSPSTSASTEDISGSAAVSGTKNPVVSAAPLSKEEVQKLMRLILNEFLVNSNYKVLSCVYSVVGTSHMSSNRQMSVFRKRLVDSVRYLV